MHEELSPLGLDVIAVGVDSSVEQVRPWIEAANPTHPSLIDTEHVVPDLWNMNNVPMVAWIDEGGRIARPPDTAFVDDRYVQYTGVESGPHLEAVRAWARGERPAMTPEEVRRHQVMPTDGDQLARIHFDLAWWLHQHGRAGAAERHFATADALAPHDFMHRRGTLRLRGGDPFGAQYREIAQAATDAGVVFKRRLPPETLQP